jgi:hypothetical protein
LHDPANPTLGHHTVVPVEVTDDGAYDRSNPKALINLLPPTMQSALDGTRNFFAHDMSDESIRKNIAHMREYPMLQKLRQSFWLEHQRVMDTDRARMEMTRVWQGITTNSGEFYGLMKRPEFAAFVFTQPVAIEVRNLALADTGFQRILEIMSVSAVEYDAHGKPTKVNDKLARVQLEIWKHADERLQGGVVKKVSIASEQKNLNVNVNQDNLSITHKIDPAAFINADEIRKKINELKSQLPDFETTSTVVEEDSDTE